MGSDRKLIRARALAVSSFIPATLLQAYTFNAGLEESDTAAYAPHPYFLRAFFAMQAGLQIYWISQLFHRKARLVRREENGMLLTNEAVASPEPTQMAYVQMYSLGNIFTVVSTLGWVNKQLPLSQVVNAACQLFFVFYTLDPSGVFTKTRNNRLTHLVVKTNAGISVLYLWKAWGALELEASRPTIQQQVHCGVLFLLLTLASGPDPTLGIWLLLDLAALVAGNTRDEWKFAFLCITGVLFVVILSDSMMARRNPPPPNDFAHARIDVEDEEELALHGSD
ncbi:hypothetical protein DFH07DRAFT_495593 [Mycena maculata]|uniref:Uncharacterized protein n=1 Tax=Mycena maculata TaxID=230809 RepID=A0AAD7J1G5_9AGAR|nr:hypothetical protein DFH07DRAFT_495593 [Mycena maculata]